MVPSIVPTQAGLVGAGGLPVLQVTTLPPSPVHRDGSALP